MKQIDFKKLVLELELGSEEAAQDVWDIYKKSVERYAKSKLPQIANAEDVSDVVQSTFKSVLNYIRGGKHKNHPVGLNSSGNFVGLLMQVAFRKVIKRANSVRRGEQTTKNFEDLIPGIVQHDIDKILEELLEELRVEIGDDDVLFKVLRLKLETNKTQKEIAESCGCGIATVERKLKIVREFLAEST